MPTMIENLDATAIRPFTIPTVPEAELEALRAHHGHPLAGPAGPAGRRRPPVQEVENYVERS